MAFSTNSRPVAGRLALFAATVVIALFVCGGEKVRSLGSDDGDGIAHVSSPGTAKKPSSAKRDKLIVSIEQRLAQLKRMPPTKKPVESDYFVIGTTEMADGLTVVNSVEFMTIAGQHEAAVAVADFLLGEAKGAKRYWQPIGRVKDKAAAKTLLAGPK